MLKIMDLNIRELRSKLGFSQRELSEATGIPIGRINNWEQNKGRPKKEDYDVLNKYFSSKSTSRDSMSISKGGSNLIPFFDVTATAGFLMEADQTPIDTPAEMIDPGTFLRGATGTLRVYGHSMYPKYPAGCIVAFKASSTNIPNVIFWGEDYVIETEDRRVVKKVDKGPTKETITAISYNGGNTEKEKYQFQPTEIALKDIRRMYMVVGKIELEASI